MYNKFYYYLSDNKKLIGEYSLFKVAKSQNSKLKFVIVIDKFSLLSGECSQTLKYILEYLQMSGTFPHDIIIGMDGDEHNYNPSEWNALKMVESHFKNKGITFGFEDKHKTWSLDEVKRANDYILNSANEIKKLKLTPFEQLLLIHLTLTLKDYKFEDSDQHFSESRSIYGVLNSDKIVCVGYSGLMESITREVGDENFRVFQNGVGITEDGKTLRGLHQNLIVYIKDEKYNIDGFYYMDPTWDSGYKGKLPSLKLSLVPIQDIKEIRPRIKNIKLLQRVQNQSSNKTITEDLIYHKKIRSEVQFTSDGLKMNREFLEFITHKFPDLKTELEKESVDTIEQKAFSAYENFEQKSEVVNILKRGFLEDGISLVENEDLLTLQRLLNEEENKELLIKTLKFRDELKNKYVLKPPTKGERVEEIFNDYLEYFELRKEDVLNTLSEVKEGDFISFVMRYNNPSKRVSDFIIEKSKPVHIKTFELGLKNLLLKMNPVANKKVVYDCVNRILEYNVNSSKNRFTRSATNTFVQQFKEKLENENSTNN